MSEFHQQLGAFEVWSFPALDEAADQIQCHISEEPEPKEPAVDMTEIVEQQQAVLNDNLAVLQEKTDLLDCITADLNRKISEVDESLLNNIVLLIKNSVRKIIHREIEMDDTLLQHMITQSLDSIKGGDSCIVYVPEEDFSLLHHDPSLSHLDIRCDHSLSRGDFIIKTKLSELEAILEQRLQSLFGL